MTSLTLLFSVAQMTLPHGQPIGRRHHHLVYWHSETHWKIAVTVRVSFAVLCVHQRNHVLLGILSLIQQFIYL